MTNIAIRVENLSKKYQIGHVHERYRTFREALVNAAKGPIQRLRSFGQSSHQEEDTIWALKDVSFEVKQGEVLGIIGANGSGKSTLLKILTRITEPTEGRAEMHGRVGSLLEVGTGFHPELTGRENVYLSGNILGMTRKEIDRRFSEIVAFSGVETFIDTPVKRYSSGMAVRLGFAVAAHLEPEILLIDEVLAVGDVEFQKKCLGKMNEVAKGGRTVLFVSHNMKSVQKLCHRAVWLNDGKIEKDGPAGEVVSSYLAISFTALTKQVWKDIATAPGNDKVRLRRASVRPANASPSDPITIRTPLVMEFEYWNLKPDTCLHLSVLVYNKEGIVVFNPKSIREPIWHGRPFPVGLFHTTCHIPGDLLNDGVYRIELLVVKNQQAIIYRHDNLLVFDVRDDIGMRGTWNGRWAGAVRPNLEWSTELVEAEQLQG